MSQNKSICLITPPSAFLVDERVFVHLGILKVAAALEVQGHVIECVDLSGVANYEEAITEHVKQSPTRVFGITATTPQMPAATRISKAIRAATADAKLILGGPHPTVTCAAVKKEKSPGRASRALAQMQVDFDVIVAGDGEDAIFQALVTPKGVIDGDDPKGPLFLTAKRLETLPWPARHLVDLDSYHYTVDGVRAHSLIAQLGCPFACGFCSGRASPMLRRTRIRSTENVLAEIEHLYTKYGFRAWMAYDDELNVNPKMVELMRGIAALAKRLGTEFRLRGFVKAELFTAEQAEVMFEAGFRWLLCGFESGHPRILKNIRKKATLEDNERMLSFARAAGIKTKALMSIGHAGESPESVEATKQWLLAQKVDDFDCTVITPYPGSPYFDEAIEVRPGVWQYTSPDTGDRLYMDEIDYSVEMDAYKGKPGEYVSRVWTDHISKAEIVAVRDDLEAFVRNTLGIPYNAGAPGVVFEASMGQTAKLPSNILRKSK